MAKISASSVARNSAMAAAKNAMLAARLTCRRSAGIRHSAVVSANAPKGIAMGAVSKGRMALLLCLPWGRLKVNLGALAQQIACRRCQ